MIYTVTLNPSIDFIVHIDQIKLGQVNRMASDAKFPGGKGINVSRILNRLNISSTALGFVGGFTGEFITTSLANEGVKTAFTTISADTRLNLKIKSTEETEINGAGPVITPAELEHFLTTFDHLTQSDIVVLSGSVPNSLGHAFYADLIERIEAKGAQFVLDTEGETLINALPHHPLLIKPNNHELAAIYNVELPNIEAMLPYGQKLHQAGAQHVIISLGKDGALLFAAQGTYFSAPITGTVKNSVGAGDSMVAGFVGKFHETSDPIEAFKWGVACGSATAFAYDLATQAEIHALLKQVTIKKLDV